MEKLFYDLSEQEFSSGRKVLLWIFSGVFFLAGAGIIFMNVVQHDQSIHITFCIPPFGIGLFTGIIAYMATSKKKDHYFLIDDDKIEYRFGLFKPVRITHKWSDINEIVMPHKERKILLKYKNNTQNIVNLNWLEKKKTHFIRRHFYHAAKEKNISIVSVAILPHQAGEAAK
jgi:hypothetical protein